MEDPIRMTKRRAVALLELASRGLDEERASIEDTFGVEFRRDGGLDVTDPGLLVQAEVDELNERVETLNEGRAAMRIFRRRYT